MARRAEASLSLLLINFAMLVLFFSSGGTVRQVQAEAKKTWCVAKPSADQATLLANVDYACSNVDCKILQKGNSCFYPNNLMSHASIAMNLYYQANGRNSWNCNFKESGPRPEFPIEEMADPYYKYASLSRGYLPSEGSAQTDPRLAAFPGYLPSEVSALASRYVLDASNLRTATELPQTENLSSRSRYGVDDLAGIGNHVSPGVGGLAAGASMRALAPLEDPALLRRDVVLAVKPGGIDFERNETLRKSEGLLADESNMLYVDGLPKDCTRREVAHLFRPFIGFKEIRVVHKEARRTGDKAYVLCFVEFNDSKCALTALEALQGYKFDDKKPDAPVLRIQFAKFPFHPPPNRDDRRHESAH